MRMPGVLLRRVGVTMWRPAARVRLRLRASSSTTTAQFRRNCFTPSLSQTWQGGTSYTTIGRLIAAMVVPGVLLTYDSLDSGLQTADSSDAPTSAVACKQAVSTDSIPVNKVVLLFAMEQEAQPFIDKHKLELIQNPGWAPQLPIVAYKGVVNGMEVFLVWAGRDKRFDVNNVATTAATLSAYCAIVEFAPQLVISAGTAGGFCSAGGRIGDVYLSTKCIFHSRRIPDKGQYSEYGYGHFRTPPLEVLATRVGCKMGVVSTSDSLDHTIRDLQIMRAEGACVKEMEAAAVAWVCDQLGVPFVAIKAITDIVDSKEATTEEEFWANLVTASSKLQTKLSETLAHLAGQPLRSWRQDSPEE